MRKIIAILFALSLAACAARGQFFTTTTWNVQPDAVLLSDGTNTLDLFPVNTAGWSVVFRLTPTNGPIPPSGAFMDVWLMSIGPTDPSQVYDHPALPGGVIPLWADPWGWSGTAIVNPGFNIMPAGPAGSMVGRTGGWLVMPPTVFVGAALTFQVIRWTGGQLQHSNGLTLSWL